MESKTNAPSFTVSLRGYDRMEVDEYLDSLAEALGQVSEAEDRNRVMQAHVDRLNARIADLEERIRRDVPRTGAVLGERIAILLRSAEETAADTIGRAESNSAAMLEKAHEEVASAEDRARGAVARGDEQARRLEAAARAEAAEIVAEAEARASARTRQIEQWAEQVVSHTRAEEARMLADQKDKQEKGDAELRALAEQRDAVAASISGLRESLGQALGLVGTVSGGALPADLASGRPTAPESDGAAPNGTSPSPLTAGYPGAAALALAQAAAAASSAAAPSDGEEGGDRREIDEGPSGGIPRPVATGPHLAVVADQDPMDDSRGGADDGADGTDGIGDETGMANRNGTDSARSGSALDLTDSPPAAEDDQPDSNVRADGSAESVVSVVSAVPDGTDGAPSIPLGAGASEASGRAGEVGDGAAVAGAVDYNSRELPWPAAFRPVNTPDEPAGDADTEVTGEIAVVPAGKLTPAELDEFETKLEAWVSGAENNPKHFRRL